MNDAPDPAAANSPSPASGSGSGSSPDPGRAVKAARPARRIPRLVVDTNLFVAWLFRPQSPGPREIVARWEAGAVRLCVSEAVLRELRATLGRLPAPAGRKAALLERLEDPAHTELVEPVPDSGFRCSDPSDDKFLHLAAHAEVDALLTSDRALLEVRDFPRPIRKSGQWLRDEGRSEE